MKISIFTFLLIALSSTVITACSDESEAEKAGNAISDAFEEAKDDLKEASDE